MSAGDHKQLTETDPWFYSDTDFDSIRMLRRSKNWLPGALWKPKNPHSLEHLKMSRDTMTEKFGEYL